jgi:hypothetical protein
LSPLGGMGIDMQLVNARHTKNVSGIFKIGQVLFKVLDFFDFI